MLVLGTVLILAAVGCLAVAVAGVPAGRVSRERIEGLTVVESKPLLTRITEGAVNGVDRVLSRRGWRPFRTEELELAGISASVGSVVVLVSAIAAGAFVGTSLIFQNPLLGVVVALLVPAVAKLVIRFRLSRRRKLFSDQLAPLLQMLASSLRAGHSLPRAMDAASRDSESPMAEELSRVVNEYRLGRDLVVAMEEVAERMDSEDFVWIAGAISASRETGGNLNEILDQVADTIRERQHIRQQVMALSAEGRISAYILMALPVCIGAYYSLVAADRMGVFIDSGIGRIILAVSALMYVAGGFWMRSIVRIEF